MTKANAESMKWGAFSISLAVKDIKASVAFYEKLDFKQTGGDIGQNWVILRNGTTTIGLFQGMFKKNIMTFNPGWNSEAKPIDQFQDVRKLEEELIKRGITPTKPIDAKVKQGNQPASFVLTDPDGNPILIDQHVPGPKSK